MIQNVQPNLSDSTYRQRDRWAESIKIAFRRLKTRLFVRSRFGQSLVEMAIAAPVLILMFLGVFEVGWALRGYMILANANRESARYAVKTATLDYSIKDPTQVGYDRVLAHTTASVAGQLPLEFLGAAPNATMIMSHFVIDTGFPCVQHDANGPIVPYRMDSANCDCTVDDPDDPQWFSRDDLVLQPDTPGYGYYSYTYGINQPTRLGGGDYGEQVRNLVLENNQFNCVALQTGNLAETSLNNIFITETLYDQPQLLGTPLVSNRFTDPIPFYTHTAMRITISRDTSATETIGPVCELHPITFAKQIFADPDSPGDNISLHLYQAGSGNPSFNWVAWDSAQRSNPRFLAEALDNPRLVLNAFTDALTGDHILSTNEPDQVTLATSAAYSNSALDVLMGGLVNQTIRVPVYDNGTDRIDHIALLNVTSVITSGNREIIGSFLGYDDAACEQ